MDPLTALSVAGTIVQFVDFGTKLLSGTIELYRSSKGTLETNDELELVTGDLKYVVIKLRTASPFPPAEDERLSAEDQQHLANFHRISDEATKIAEELLIKLASLRIKDGKNRVWQSLKVAVKAAWSEDNIVSLKQRLSSLRQSLHSQSMLLLGQKIDRETVRTSARFDFLDERTQQILIALVDSKGELSRDIIDSIANLLSRSDAINQNEHIHTRQMIADLRSTVLKTAVGVITAQVEMLAVGDKEEQIFRESIQTKILRTLQYPDMSDRYEAVLEAHPRTFDWVFRDATRAQLPWANFGEWLRGVAVRDDDKIYWINGKPGSGKSTLMRHICDDTRTEKYILDWSGKTFNRLVPYCIAKFFFWTSGSNMQKSVQGLLRSLLFQILGKHPDLIPIAFPTRWASLYNRSLDLCQQIQPESFSVRQLHDAFEKMITQKQMMLNLCFLIDGLDEYSGDTEQLCVLFKRLTTRSSSVKFCLSSRPWVPFQQSLAGCPSLRLQDLTSGDITIYVNDKFQESPAFVRRAAVDATIASAFKVEIVRRAEGVFLWVEVVIRLLLKGLAESDTISQLWTLLISFPTELYALYESLLSRIQRRHFEWASKAFQLMIASTQISNDPFRKRSASTSSNHFLDDEGRDNGVHPLTLVELSFALEGLHESKDSNLMSMLEVIEVYLSARCAGLLEVTDFEDSEGISSAFKRIRWMHRTACDFVCERKIWTITIAKDCFREPSVCFTLMSSCIISLEVLKGECVSIGKYEVHQSSLTSLASNALIYAYHADGGVSTRKIRSQLLERLMDLKIPFPKTTLLPRRGKFWHRATLYCLTDFLEDMLSEDRSTRQGAAAVLLDLLCSSKRYSSLDYPFPTSRIIDFLLGMGNFPPRRVLDEEFVDYTRRFPGVKGTFSWNEDNFQMPSAEVSCFVENQAAIIESFLLAGVDPTDTLGVVPKDFVFRKEAIQDRVQIALQAVWTNHTVEILAHIKQALIEEVRLHKNGNRMTEGRNVPRSIFPTDQIMLDAEGATDSDD